MALTGNIYGARPISTAWVNFNGTGTIAIKDSFNISSLTDNAVANYTVNLSISMAATNYGVVASRADSTDATTYNARSLSPITIATTYVDLIGCAGGASDLDTNNFACFGDIA